MGYERTTRTVKKEEEYVSAAWCDRCKKQLKVEYDAQARDAANIRMSGWYTGYLDLEVIDWLLCDQCCAWLQSELGPGKRETQLWR